MTHKLRCQLRALADPAYKSFQQPLLPGVQNYLGVRLPQLHRLARQLAKGDWQAQLALPDQTFEEVMLRGMVIGLLPLAPPKLLPLVRDFLPRIDNWSICDTFCASLKQAKLYKQEFWELALSCAAARQEFTARFGAVMLLWYWAGPQDVAASLRAYAAIQCPAFYARMAVAWGYSVFAATDFGGTLAAMRAARLDDATWNRALQKMRESRRIGPEQKELCRQWKRKQV